MNDPTPRELEVKVAEMDRRYEQRFLAHEKATNLAHSDSRANVALLVSLLAGILSALAVIREIFFRR